MRDVSQDDMDLRILFSSVVVAAGVVCVALWSCYPRWRRLKRIRGRQDLSAEEIYSRFFGPKGFPRDLTLELWREVAATLRLPPGRLRPTDRFDRELAPPRGWDLYDPIDEVRYAAEDRMERSGSYTDFRTIKTLGDYVAFFCEPPAEAKGRPHRRPPRIIRSTAEG
jgi:hypothetical protein